MHASKLFLATALVLSSALSPSVAQASEGVSAEQALQRLMAGNKRFVAHESQHPDYLHHEGKAKSQHPLAVVVGCADSRVPPELVFDHGQGDLFVIRLIGNTANESVHGSVEYALGHLEVPLVVVLGHERCGAVTAAVQGGDHHHSLKPLLHPIAPAVAKSRNLGGDPVEQAVKANVRKTVQDLRAFHATHGIQGHGGGEVKFVGAYYDLDTGKAELVKEE